jgi:hypothetical protein
MPSALRSTENPFRTARLAVPALGLALILGGCTPSGGFTDTWNPAQGAWVPFSRSQPVLLDSLTAQRVRGSEPEFTPVMPEPGNVWPAQEAERPTLMGGPEEAMRNVPEYRPSLVDSVPPARSPVETPGVGPRRGSSSPPPLPPSLLETPRQPPVSSAPPPPPPRPAEGRVMTDPSGRPATTTGQAGNVSGFTQPGGSGAVHRDGNVETWIGPDGQTRTRVAPLR